MAAAAGGKGEPLYDAGGLPRQLAGLSALIGHHFGKEEDVLLPVLDRSLSEEQAGELFSSMGQAAHH